MCKPQLTFDGRIIDVSSKAELGEEDVLGQHSIPSQTLRVSQALLNELQATDSQRPGISPDNSKSIDLVVAALTRAHAARWRSNIEDDTKGQLLLLG
jgi:hypothetical protein